MFIEKPSDITEEQWQKYWDDWNTEWREKYDLQQKKLIELGYISKYGTDRQRGPYLAPNGMTYKTADEYYLGMGYMPRLIKDGVWYGYYRILEKHNLEFKMNSVSPISLVKLER